MPLLPAQQPQLIRSSQKDEFYQNCLRNQANEAVQSLAGKIQEVAGVEEGGGAAVGSGVLWVNNLVCTLEQGYQTLGEEYVSIIQVDPSKRRVPSRTRRVVLILLHTFVPYLLDKALICLENELQAEGLESRAGWSEATRSWNPVSYLRAQMRRAVRLLTEEQKKALLPAVLVLQQGVTLLHRFHVAFFYINGAFYHLAKRAAGISYLRVQGEAGESLMIRTSYKVLGVVSLLQLALTLTLQLNNFRQRRRAREEWKLHRNLPSR
ncbi:peroxisome biogenesis factor 10-like [Scleropages formosus]|uniref:RING-type E3 ubiquitin transferase n=1 Tax=Scleropages formosus TaxID=113540 RepID=A0A0P7TUM2_SCLFO|nr:peroxisome biogenesis factor 10-like [Scleropages formosus]